MPEMVGHSWSVLAEGELGPCFSTGHIRERNPIPPVPPPQSGGGTGGIKRDDAGEPDVNVGPRTACGGEEP